MRILLLLLLTAVTTTARERWIYIPANYQVDAQADRVISLLERAGKAGYDHALLADSKFARLDSVIDRYFDNVGRVKEAAARFDVELVPAVFPVGYSNALLFHDPNLAAGLPVRDALFVVRNNVAELRPDPPVVLKAGDMSKRKAWRFVDDTLVSEDGTMHSSAPAANARMMQEIKVAPFRHYHVSVRIRSRGFGGGEPRVAVLTTKGRALQYTNLKLQPEQDWSTHDVTFNSLENDVLRLYFGVWGGHRGDIWWDDASIGECGPVNILRRPGAPLVIRREDGTRILEEHDFEPLIDPLMGSKPWPGEYTAWHQAPVIRTRGLADGTRLRASWYHPHIIYDGQVCACTEEPATRVLLCNEARSIASLWGAKAHLMSHDEWRVLGWDESCHKGKRSPGEIVAASARYCTGLLGKTNPGGRVLVWSDMFDPHHNARDDYYLVNGSLKGSWEGLDPEVVVMNWNFGKRADSLRFFADRGHSQIIAGFYDGPLDHVDQWLKAARDIPHVDGFMYTTWRNDFSKLEQVARLLEAGDF